VQELLRNKEQQDNVMMAFLPPYSPELNPDEQIWNYAQREVAKRIIHNLGKLSTYRTGLVQQTVQIVALSSLLATHTI
jgi:transposase